MIRHFCFDFSVKSFGFLADLKAVLSDEEVYNEAAMEAFPVYNKSHMICLEMPSRAGDVSYHLNLKRILS